MCSLGLSHQKELVSGSNATRYETLSQAFQVLLEGGGGPRLVRRPSHVPWILGFPERCSSLFFIDDMKAMSALWESGDEGSEEDVVDGDEVKENAETFAFRILPGHAIDAASQIFWAAKIKPSQGWGIQPNKLKAILQLYAVRSPVPESLANRLGYPPLDG